MFDEKIDILEDSLLKYNAALLKILLEDKTTKKNIIWATNDYYEQYFDGYEAYQEIRVDSVSGIFGKIIQPRIAKDKSKQIERTKNHAEVFTPSWICNKQNNLVDAAWFGRENVFNKEDGSSWITNKEKICFEQKGKTWQKYVDAKRLEIACGEAPYIVSRYDHATGQAIDIENRIGLLDRKLRVVCENSASCEEWLKWSLRAVQSVYGYEYQGDNVLLARENILYTYIDFYRLFTKNEPSEKLLLQIANVIAWNIWQMDGLTNKPPEIIQQNRDSAKNLQQPFCTIKDWRAKELITIDSIGK